jgi:vacuolar protein sorting-associated protein 26
LQPYVPIKYEVGIEDWLHLIFEFDRTKYHSKDTVSGTVTFKKVSIRLKSMELQIIKKETIGAGTTAIPENEIIAKYEIMDGGPIKSKTKLFKILDETIPIRFFISPYELSPSYANINNKFSIQYFINLVLIDVEGRRYFKQHEIQVIRIYKETTK